MLCLDLTGTPTEQSRQRRNRWVEQRLGLRRGTVLAGHPPLLRPQWLVRSAAQHAHQAFLGSGHAAYSHGRLGRNVFAPSSLHQLCWLSRRSLNLGVSTLFASCSLPCMVAHATGDGPAK